jgi:hypothetical protein
MAAGWALNVRGNLKSLAAFFILAFAGLLIQSLRLVLPPSYGVSYALSAVALVLIVVAFKYDRFFKRGGSSTE